MLDAQWLVRLRMAAVCKTVGFAVCIVAGATVGCRMKTLRWVQRSLSVMVDPADALQDPVTQHADRGQIQRDWISASAECGHQARKALAKAAEVLAAVIPGRRADTELARAWAELAQGWASLSHAEAARSIAAAAFAVDQSGVNTFPSPWSRGSIPHRRVSCDGLRP